MKKSEKYTLKDQWSGNTDFLVIDRQNLAAYQDVFKKAYNEVYLPNFPASAGYDTWQDFMNIFQNPKSPIDLKVTVAGVDLRGKQKVSPAVKGICISFYYKESDAAMLMYLAVDPAYRTEGLGNALFKNHHSIMVAAARANGGKLSGSYISMQDPQKPLTPEHAFDKYDPQKRLDKYAAWGGQQIPFDYIYGVQTGNTVETGDECVLMAFKHPVDGTYPSREQTLKFMRSLWRGYGVQEPEKHPAFQKMVQSYKKPPQPRGPKPL